MDGGLLHADQPSQLTREVTQGLYKRIQYMYGWRVGLLHADQGGHSGTLNVRIQYVHVHSMHLYQC